MATMYAFSTGSATTLNVFTHAGGIWSYTGNNFVVDDPGTDWQRGMAVQNSFLYGLATGSTTVLNVFQHNQGNWTFVGPQSILNDPGSDWDQGISITNFHSALGPPSMMVFKDGSETVFNVFNYNGVAWAFVGENFLAAGPGTDWSQGFATQFYSDDTTTALYGFAVPEPSGLVLWCLGLLISGGLCLRRCLRPNR